MSQKRDLTILVVDDEEISRYAATRLLRQAGYHVTEAVNGEEALVLAEEQPNLVLLDIQLPDMLGFDVCRQLKSEPRTAAIPVLLYSATYIDHHHYVQGLEEYGADAYMAEPAEPGVLLATVGALLRSQQAEEALRQARDELEMRVAERTAELAASNRQLQQEIGERKQAQEKAQRLSRLLIEASEEERRRLSRDLHDSAGQIASALLLNLSLLYQELPAGNEKLTADFEEARGLARKIYDEIRTVSHALRPPELESLGLDQALQELCRDVSKFTRQAVSYQGAALPRLSDTVAITFYRFVQEALTNATKHAQADHIRVVLDYQAGRPLTVAVEDDGIGFDLPGTITAFGVSSSAGAGLVSMQERLQMLGGHLQIHSMPGLGTRLVATSDVAGV